MNKDKTMIAAHPLFEALSFGAFPADYIMQRHELFPQSDLCDGTRDSTFTINGFGYFTKIQFPELALRRYAQSSLSMGWGFAPARS